MCVGVNFVHAAYLELYITDAGVRICSEDFVFKFLFGLILLRKIGSYPKLMTLWI